MTVDSHRRLVTGPEAADLVDVAPSTIRRWAHEHRLVAYATVGRRHLYREADVLMAEAKVNATRRRSGLANS